MIQWGCSFAAQETWWSPLEADQTVTREYSRCKNSESRLQRSQVTTIMLIDPWWIGERGKISDSPSDKTGDSVQFGVCGIIRKETESPNEARDITN